MIELYDYNQERMTKGGGLSLPPRDYTPCRPKGSPLCSFLRYLNFATDPEFLLKASCILSWAQLYTNFEGSENFVQKRIFFGSNFQEKKAFSSLLKKIWPKQGLFSTLGEFRKPICSTQKKLTKFPKILGPPSRKS